MSKTYKTTITGIGLFLIMMYVFFRSILLVLVGDFATYIMIIALLIVWGTSFRYVLKQKNLFQTVGLWGVFGIIIILNNKYLFTSGISFTTIVTVGGIVTSVFLANSKREWQKFFVKNIKRCVNVHIVATIFFAIFPNIYRRTMLQFYSGAIQEVLTVQVKDRCVPGLTSHYSTNGIYLAIALMLYGCEMFNNDKERTRNKMWFILSLVSLVLTGKRAHLVFSIFAVAMVYILFKKERSQSKIIRLLFLGICASVALVIIVNFVPFLSVTVFRFINMMGEGDLTNGRYYFYDYAIEWFKESPVFGIGWESFVYRLNKLDGAYVKLFEYMNAHNVYLQVLCELGIIGFFFFMSKLIQDFYLTIKRYNWKGMVESNLKSELSLAFAMHVFFVLYCITGNPLYDIEIFFPYIISMSMLYKYIRYDQVKGGN